MTKQDLFNKIDSFLVANNPNDRVEWDLELKGLQKDLVEFAGRNIQEPPVVRILQLGETSGSGDLAIFGGKTIWVTESETTNLIGTLINGTDGTMNNEQILYTYQNGIVNLMNRGQPIGICLVSIFS